MATRLSIVLVVAAITAGTWADRAPARPPQFIGGYRVIVADFHVHTILLSAFDVVLEARRRGLDAFALTPHNQTFSARLGHWFAQLVGGPTVIVGEEVRSPNYHLIAAGIDHTVSWNQPAADAIADVHRQGGVAIAAHPDREFWNGYDEAAMRALDGAEIAHPTAFVRERVRIDMQQFFMRAPLTAIGSSDYHGIVPMGTARTYVFATGASEGAILDALRHHRTVVYDAAGRPYGDPELIRLSEGQLPKTIEGNAPNRNWLAWASRILGIVGLFALAART